MGAKKFESVICKNCDELMIYHFDKARSTGDLRWLVMDYTGREEVVLPENIEEVFSEIMNEYCIKTGDNRSLQYYELALEVNQLSLAFEISKALIGCLLSNATDKAGVITELRHRGFNYDENKPFYEEVKRLERQLKQRRTKVNRKVSELKAFKEENDDDEEVNIYRQKVNLMQITGITDIDLKKTSVSEWVEIGKVAKQQVSQKRRWQATR